MNSKSVWSRECLFLPVHTPKAVRNSLTQPFVLLLLSLYFFSFVRLLHRVHREQMDKWQEEINELRLQDASNEAARTLLQNAQDHLLQNVREDSWGAGIRNRKPLPSRWFCLLCNRLFTMEVQPTQKAFQSSCYSIRRSQQFTCTGTPWIERFPAIVWLRLKQM